MGWRLEFEVHVLSQDKRTKAKAPLDLRCLRRLLVCAESACKSKVTSQKSDRRKEEKRHMQLQALALQEG